ncbi:dynein axonemal heavy chain 7-like [Homarus americanus]|nr:dynein axonemal heavy chain 7-like [Homarus americanus]XP_042228783.1 dynein axonemal heavy chain 7-like [Homarus americanus]
MIKIEQDTIQVERKQELVAADEAVANKKFADAQAIKDDCEKELAKAVPALNAATDALNTLKQDDIRVVKAMKNPPSGVKLVSITYQMMTLVMKSAHLNLHSDST